MESVLLCADLLPVIFSYLHRHEAAQVARVHSTWAAAVRNMTAIADDKPGLSPFRTRILIGCCQLGRLVDISGIIDGVDGATIIQQRAAGTQARRSRSKLHVSSKGYSTWLTSSAMCPYGVRDYYCCEYKCGGVTCVNGRHLQHRRVAARHAAIREPEGIAFAHHCMYIQNNWGLLTRCTLQGQVLESKSMFASPEEGVTWSLEPGPDNALYVTVDQPYPTRIYTEVPPHTSGYVMRVALTTSGNIHAPGARFTHAAMKRPCGLRWGPVCSTLFVTCLDPAVMRFAGPHHARPGSLLCCITPQPAALLPWDVVVVNGTTLLVSMHAHRSVRVRKAGMLDAWPTGPAVCNCSCNEAGCSQPVRGPPLREDTTAGAGSSMGKVAGAAAEASSREGVAVTAVQGKQAQKTHKVTNVDLPAGLGTGDRLHGNGHQVPASSNGQQAFETGNSQQAFDNSNGQQVLMDAGAGGSIDADLLSNCNVVCVMEELGHGRVRIVQLPNWMHHANMMCTDDPYPRCPH